MTSKSDLPFPAPHTGWQRPMLVMPQALRNDRRVIGFMLGDSMLIAILGVRYAPFLCVANC